MRGRPFNEIVSIMRQRRTQDSLLLNQMIMTRDRVNGDIVIPLFDTSGEPNLTPPSPRLIADAIDHTAMRAAQQRAVIACPSTDLSSKTATKRADTRKKALYGRWHSSQLWDVKLYRSYRHLVGYGTNCFIVLPDEIAGHAAIELRDPLTAYPELRAPDDIRDPLNVGFIFGRSVEWIAQHYPEATNFLKNAAGRNWDTLWDMVEWVDEDEVVVGILGPRMPAYGAQDSRPYGYNGYELRRWENKAGMVPVCCPRRVTLDRIMGQIGALIGLVDLYDRMTALMVVAAEKGIFADIVAIGPNENDPPQLIDGEWHDGRTGKVNRVVGGTVNYLTNTPGPYTGQLLDRLETAIRESGNATNLFGGENPAGLRTGRAIDSLGSFSVDPRVEEAQKIMARALTSVNEAVVATEKGYFGNRKLVAFTGWSSEESTVEYTPDKDFDSVQNVVEYPFPGVDVSQISVALGQLQGMGAISLKTMRTKHPFIDDPDQEESLVDMDGIKKAVLGGLEQALASDPMQVPLGVKVLAKMRQGADFVDAIVAAHEEAQKEQAAAQQAAPGAPETQPGLGAGPNNPPTPAVPPPAPGLQNLRDLVGAINAHTAPQAV